MSDENLTPEEETVGYGKPPKKDQYKPGQSGNPNGRPKGSVNLPKAISKHAAKKVVVLENGVKKKMAKLDVVISAMFNKASKGDVAAARLLTTLILAAKQLSGEDYQSGFSEADLAAILVEADWQAKLVKLKQEQTDGNF